ncbi:MAG TPA: antibiotic biosynthesis monooxygenase [Geminicoccaceae bacterium]
MASGGFVVLAGFRLQAGPRGRFPEADRADAEASVRDEPRCRHFDVLITDEVPDTVPPHEVHDDAAALAAHLSSSRSATPGRSGPGGER